MKRLILAVTCSLVFSPARADLFDPAVSDICAPVPKPQHPGRLVPRLLIGQLLKNQALSDIDIDATGGDVSYAQKVEAIISGPGFCSRPGAHCAKDAASKLGAVQATLVAYIQRHLSPVPSGASGYQFTFIVNTPNLRDFFLNQNSTLVPACLAAPPPNGSATPPAADNSSRVPGRLVIRKNITDLMVGQTDPAFKGVEQATFSINSDQLQSSTTYNIQGVIGYAFGQTPIAGWNGAYAEFAPFVAYTRQFVDGKNPNKTANVDNIGLGVVGDFLLPGNAFQSALPFGKGIYNDIQLSAQEVHSDVSATDIVSAKVTYSPFFDPTVLPGVGTTERAGDFLLLFSPQAVFISGDVLDNGNNPNLSKTGTYQRVGTHLAYSATADTGLLNGFQFIATYDYLKSYGGPVSNITLLTTTLSYAIPQTNFWSVKLQYQDGRNLDTLVKQKLITLGLGLKY